MQCFLSKRIGLNMSEKYRTLFISGVHGQFRLWKRNIEPEINTSDKSIQLGNIIGCNGYAKDKGDRGPNNAILKYNKMAAMKNIEWVQIIGSNEMAALNFPEEWLCLESRKFLRDLWFDSKSTAKVADVDKGRLVTHGGLTYGEWISIGSPKDAKEAAERLNDRYLKTLYQGDAYKLTGKPNFSANPIWADPLLETYGSWITAPVECPFNQIHGSSNLYLKENRSLTTDPNSLISYADKVSFNNYGSIVTIKDRKFTSVDLGLDGPILKTLDHHKVLYLETSQKT